MTIDQLTAGTAEPIVVVDFLQLSGRQLAEALSAHSDGHPIYRIDPVTDLAGIGEYQPLDLLAAGYADECAAKGLAGRDLTVAGYCSAAALSLLLAARLAGRANVRSILVQPTWPDARSIITDFSRFRTDLGAYTDSGPGLASDDDGLPDLAASPDVILEQMHGVLDRDLRAMAEARGLDVAGTALADLLARYRAWLGFALSSRDALRGPWPLQMRSCLLLDASAEPAMPWSDARAYRVARLPAPDGESPDDAALAGCVLAHARAWDGGAA